MSPEPESDAELNPGDSVRLFVKASTGAHVTASMGDAAPVLLSEKRIKSLNPSDKDRILGDAVAGGDEVGGLYQGEMRIPAPATGVLHVTYTVTAIDSSQVKATAKGTLNVLPSGSYRVGTIVLADRKKDIDARPFGIVEAEPDGGWLFFPPEHTPLEVTGRIGDYERVALGTAEQGWIERHSLSLSREGRPKPHTSVEGVVVVDGARASTVVIHLTERAPFWISEFTDPPSLKVRLFNAFAATEFMRYGNDRSNVAEIRWDQPQGGIVTMDIKLRQRTLWGYHAQWDGNDLKLMIKKLPRFAPAPASALRGLLVVIDPGHSPDSGSIGPLGTQERDVNLSIAKRLAVHLESLGARTLLTRYANTAVGLYDRTDLARHANADILVSVHNNALPDGVNPFTHHGFSVYYYQPQSLGLARAIHSAYGRDTSLPDYGLYYDNLALVRPTEEPAVLTESAFIMWPPEEMDLRNPAFQDRLGATIADGIDRWAASMRARE
jgi:N-acetylmuramoyl-L-alanine amidase